MRQDLHPKSTNYAKNRVPTLTASAHRSQSCSFCHQNHFIKWHPTFRSQSFEKRKNFVNSKWLCLNCLGPHTIGNGKSEKTCHMCKARHHTLLDSEDKPPLNGKDEQPQTISVSPHLVSQKKSVLLATALVTVFSATGESILVRALIDQGSEVSIVAESLAQCLNFPRFSNSIAIFGIGGESSTSARELPSFQIASRFNQHQRHCINALILPRLTSYHPPRYLVTIQRSHLTGLNLADDVTSSKPIELLLGADIYHEIIKPGLRKGAPEMPNAQNTSLNWILSGVASTEAASSVPLIPTFVVSLQCTIDEQLLSSVKRFWQQEDLFHQKQFLTSEEIACEEHFSQTHSRLPDGRYVVRLPFKSSPRLLGNSKWAALSAFFCLDKRLVNDPSLQKSYQEFLNKYKLLGHMERITIPMKETFFYLISHHGVNKNSSTATKLRVVFNASQKTTSGISLHDILHVGPQLIPNLGDITLRWRKPPVVFSADIEKMYRQVSLNDDDQNFQLILWKTSKNEDPKLFRLKTVTYGMTCAP